MSGPVAQKTISVEVNGTTYEREVEARRLLVHFIRDDLDLTGTHVGCDTGNCGACSVMVDGTLLKSCMMEGEIRRAIQGNICRCTGYVNIVEAIAAASKAAS